MARENERYIPYNVCDTPLAHVATLFPNAASLLRLVSAVLNEISDDWETQQPFFHHKSQIWRECWSFSNLPPAPSTCS